MRLQPIDSGSTKRLGHELRSGYSGHQSREEKNTKETVGRLFKQAKMYVPCNTLAARDYIGLTFKSLILNRNDAPLYDWNRDHDSASIQFVFLLVNGPAE